MNSSYQELINFVGNMLLTRLTWIKDKPSTIRQKGEHYGLIQRAFSYAQWIHDEDTPCTWMIDFMNLMWVYDVPSYLAKCRAQTTCLFATVTLGENTFWQLRQALGAADEAIYGGTCIRIIPMIHSRQMALLLRRAEFQDVVSDVERMTLTYASLQNVFKDMRACQMTRPLFPNRPLSKNVQEYAENYLFEHFGNPFSLSLDFVFGIGFTSNAR